MVTLHDIRAAQTLLHGIAVRTPLFEWTTAADPRKLFLKLENLQPIGAFKLRGAYNKVASLSDEEKSTIAKWVAAGSPEGNPKDLPEPRQYAGSWFLITFSRRVEFAGISIYLAKTYSTSGAALGLAMMALVQAIPIILLAIPAGQIADRYNRHRVMAISFSQPLAASSKEISMS